LLAKNQKTFTTIEGLKNRYHKGILTISLLGLISSRAGFLKVEHVTRTCDTDDDDDERCIHQQERTAACLVAYYLLPTKRTPADRFRSEKVVVSLNNNIIILQVHDFRIMHDNETGV
jgi:hypothetical protein